jgi:hypothetical protein
LEQKKESQERGTLLIHGLVWLDCTGIASGKMRFEMSQMQLKQCTTMQEWEQLPMQDLEPKKKAQCASYKMCFSR